MEKPEMPDQILDPMGLSNPGRTRGFTGMGVGSARQDSVGRVSGWVRTDTFLRPIP